MEIYYWKEGTDRRTGNRREELPGTRFAFCHLVSLHPESVKKRKAYMYRRIRERMIINMRVVGRVKRGV